MAAPRPMRAFYLTLGIIAVLGGILIVRQAGLLRPSRSVTETLASAPVAPMTGVAASGHVIGSDSAPVEIVEFADFECPACARFAILDWPEVQQRLLPTGRLKWRFMNFPLQGHTASPPAHLAAGCAGEQGRFFEMMEAIYNRKSSPFERSIDMHISHLRKKLERDRTLIKTVRGVGYQFCRTPEEGSAA